jgi:DNA-binding CsgD family transcriptional regulator
MLAPNGFHETLTDREIEVIKLIATGLSTKEIARSLGIAFKTAACHRSRIMSKLNIHEVANLTRYAIRMGYVDTGGNERRSGEQAELFERIKVTEAKYRQATRAYHDFLIERESIGLTNPDGVTGARRLRQVEEEAHREYHASLLGLKDWLLSK